MITMTTEKFCRDGYELLSLKGIKELSNCDEALIQLIEEDCDGGENYQGTQDNGPYDGFWWGKLIISKIGLYVIARTSDFSKQVVFFDTKKELDREWDNIYLGAIRTAYDSNDLEYFDFTQDDYESALEYVLNRRIGHHCSELRERAKQALETCWVVTAGKCASDKFQSKERWVYDHMEHQIEKMLADGWSTLNSEWPQKTK